MFGFQLKSAIRFGYSFANLFNVLRVRAATIIPIRQLDFVCFRLYEDKSWFAFDVARAGDVPVRSGCLDCKGNYIFVIFHPTERRGGRSQKTSANLDNSYFDTTGHTP